MELKAPPRNSCRNVEEQPSVVGGRSTPEEYVESSEKVCIGQAARIFAVMSIRRALLAIVICLVPLAVLWLGGEQPDK